MRRPVFRHDLHVALWDWLASNPDKSKYQWPGWVHNGGHFDPGLNFCVACIYNSHSLSPTKEGTCHKCPMCKEGGPTLYACLEGAFRKWHDAPTLRGRSYFARKIRDLPLRDDWSWAYID